MKLYIPHTNPRVCGTSNPLYGHTAVIRLSGERISYRICRHLGRPSFTLHASPHTVPGSRFSSATRVSVASLLRERHAPCELVAGRCLKQWQRGGVGHTQVVALPWVVATHIRCLSSRATPSNLSLTIMASNLAPQPSETSTQLCAIRRRR